MITKTRTVIFSLVITGTLLLGACAPIAPAASPTIKQAAPAVEAAVENPVADQPAQGQGVVPVAAYADQSKPEAEQGQSSDASALADQKSAGNPPAGAPPAGEPGGKPPSGAPPAGGPGGKPPAGAPPAGDPGENSVAGAAPAARPLPGGAGGATIETALATARGTYTLDGGSAEQTDQIYTAAENDQSGIYVINGATLTLTNPTINTSGGSSSADYSSFYGLNAGLLATTASAVKIKGGAVTTSGDGANGIFATSKGTSITISDVKIKATGQYAHGVMATNAATLTLTNVDMDTQGANSGAIATDRGSGTIKASGGKVTTSGQDSPGIYSTGAIEVAGAEISASGAEAAVIEGANAITLTDTNLSSSKADKWGVMIYQSMSGDAEGTKGTFTMTGGSLAYTGSKGPLFYVTNSTGVITLKGVDATVNSGTLLKASAGNWGTSGANGGTVLISAVGQTLQGDLLADALSEITLHLQNASALQGAINPDGAAKAANLTLDSDSIWNVTLDSNLTCLDDSDGISGTTITDISGNGNTVTYKPDACPALAGKTYSLDGGGSLKPVE